MKESKLLSLLFHVLDKTEYAYPNVRDEVLNEISIIYGKDMVDTYNSYINCIWANQDNADPNQIILEYIAQTGV